LAQAVHGSFFAALAVDALAMPSQRKHIMAVVNQTGISNLLICCSSVRLSMKSQKDKSKCMCEPMRMKRMDMGMRM